MENRIDNDPNEHHGDLPSQDNHQYDNSLFTKRITTTKSDLQR